MNLENDLTKGTEQREYCHVCKRSQKHIVLSSVLAKGWEDWGEAGGIHFSENSEILQCQGCESFSFKSSSWNSESYNPETGQAYISSELFPNRSEKTLAPKSLLNVPENIKEIYRESIDAYNHGQRVLCSAGIRAIVESICVNKGIKQGTVRVVQRGVEKAFVRKTLEGKLNGMLQQGILTQALVDSLHETRLIGNEAVHQLKKIESEELETALSIVETILDAIYELPIKTETLRNRK